MTMSAHLTNRMESTVLISIKEPGWQVRPTARVANICSRPSGSDDEGDEEMLEVSSRDETL